MSENRLKEIKEFIGQKLIRVEFQEGTNNAIFIFETGAIIQIPIIVYKGGIVKDYELKKLLIEK